eukprot:SAG25_NODE_9309_length_378_cov_0.806452_1_plen_90_part_01
MDTPGQAMWYEWDAITMRTHTKPNQLLLFNDLLIVARPSRAATHPLNYREHLPLVSQNGWLLSRRGCSLPASVSGFDTHCDAITSRSGRS